MTPKRMTVSVLLENDVKVTVDSYDVIRVSKTIFSDYDVNDIIVYDGEYGSVANFK